jgi:hypothetical protein
MAVNRQSSFLPCIALNYPEYANIMISNKQSDFYPAFGQAYFTIHFDLG